MADRPKNPAAVALGSLGGKTKTERKAESSRQNGKKGGRPKHTAHCIDMQRRGYGCVCGEPAMTKDEHATLHDYEGICPACGPTGIAIKAESSRQNGKLGGRPRKAQ